MIPTRGRIVWYTPRVQLPRLQPSEYKAAIIVDVDPNQGLGPGSAEENTVGVYLTMFSRGDVTFSGSPVRYHPDGPPGTWRWPQPVAPVAPPLPL